jgi:NAD+ synthase (glutamine-hydrolysing)
MSRTLRVVVGQLDLRVGDLDGNVDAMVATYRRAESDGADLVVFPELAVCGYPPEDLLLKPAFVTDVHRALHRLAGEVVGHAAVVAGWVDGERHPGADPHDPEDGPWNAAAVLHGGRVVGSYHKRALPNYGVFDEPRYFDPGPAGQALYDIAGVTVAVTVCEDLWVQHGPVAEASGRGAELVVNLNASPFRRGKQRRREEVLAARVDESGVPIVYVNTVGGQDELVFDGGSLVVGGDGGVVARAPRFECCELTVDVPVAPAAALDADRPPPDVVRVSAPLGDRPPPAVSQQHVAPLCHGEEDPLEEVWSALVLGVRSYVDKNGFDEVVIGLSGGVDSSIVAALAVDALGPDRVHGVLMPSRYSSDHSVSDAEALCALLGLSCRTVPIEPAHAAFTSMLEPSFEGHDTGLTDQNVQSRIRGVVLMALSNAFGWLVLTTGNKSETAVGYSTLYGDTAGGLAVIKDVPKTVVYELCHWRNRRGDGERIPAGVLTKAPSAELAPDQRDDQSLPSYDELDPIIEAYVDGDLTAPQIVAAGHDPEIVARVVRLVDTAEYKRRQAPPGLRISAKAFGRDRRLPITNAYRPPSGGH